MPLVLNENRGLAFQARNSARMAEPQKSIYDIMKFFESTPRTEAAFYLRFQQAKQSYIQLLMSYYGIQEEWQVFKKICKFWNVK
jgi:hypothetical protein